MADCNKVILRETVHWGVVRLYPVNDIAKFMCKIGNRKIFSDDWVDDVKRLGFKVEVQ